ncbi:Hypothetical protein SRAE_2000495600 [Strongyloides ratti]|uniref:Cystatin domain-containing protein n=1 Tax=Strongyloides ratti TaxID=34506 RepID=A0A090LKT8_STRRB|nr:Hypothetical protein SRAE_2000495600 [Strongyloides ratti]CEF70323.1 Hypothetical protein SRAE_2000495600 [Strongyloides ratti]
MKYTIVILLLFIPFNIYIHGAARFDAWEEVSIEDDKIKNYALKGLEEYKKTITEPLEFRRLIDAQKKVAADVRYRINFLGRVKGCPLGGGCTRRFRVKVIENSNGDLLSMEIILKASS